MFIIGDVPDSTRKLVEETKKCMELGIIQVIPGGRTGDIGHAIQTHAESLGFSVVRDFCGHGVGVDVVDVDGPPVLGRVVAEHLGVVAQFGDGGAVPVLQHQAHGAHVAADVGHELLLDAEDGHLSRERSGKRGRGRVNVGAAREI